MNHETEKSHGSEETAGAPIEGKLDATTELMVRKPEMAKRLFVTERTVENYMRLRKIPFVKNGRLVFFKASEVEAALFRKIGAEEARTEDRARGRKYGGGQRRAKERN